MGNNTKGKLKKMEHALQRFAERYGRELCFGEYMRMVYFLRAGLGECLHHNVGGGNVYQFEWGNEIIYAIMNQSKRHERLILTFLTAEMALGYIGKPYLRTKNLIKNQLSNDPEGAINK